MVEAFKKFCTSKNIAIEGVKTIVTVSGGIDSVVMAQLFQIAGAEFVIAHCNFRLRGNESNEDENFVKEMAKRMDVPFYCKSFKTNDFAQENGISIQMAARELRYAWFEQLKVKAGCDQIATAHHKGDTVETVLFNMAKGTGLEGLHGIKVKNGSLIRPLLFATRAEIEQFAKKHKITWREDSSNASNKYSRNKIRLQVVPILEEINPQAQEAIASTAERVYEAEQFLCYQVQELLKKISRIENENIFINTKQLEALPGSIYVLHRILKPLGFNYAQSVQIRQNLQNGSGKLFYSKTHVVNVDREEIVITPLKEGSASSYFLSEKPDFYSIGNFFIQTRVVQSDSYSIDSASTILAFDMDKLTFPLSVRVWNKGDTFQPLGMKGKKKLSDFMIDAKIPVNLKNNVWVVISDNLIAGVINHRLDDRFKITKQTKTVFEISVHEA